MTLADCLFRLQDDISVVPGSCRPRVATTNLSNSCICGLERFQSARNDTFVDSELCSYTGDGTPLLQLSDNSSTCEVVQVISSSLISRTDSLALAANMLNCVFVLHFILLLNSTRRRHAFCVRSRRLRRFVPDICIRMTFLLTYVFTVLISRPPFLQFFGYLLNFYIVA
ncbi:hypothetical protein TNCV_1771461 [Trichonephila clavipes]|nr:hypothetical protein TNCV_1771461 [Trichonephila clavipes]